MATIQFARKEDGSGSHRPILIRVTTDTGQVLNFEAEPGAFSLGLVDHKPISVEVLEPEVERPRAI